MELTVGYLKKVLEHLDDNIVLANLQYGNDEFKPFSNIKRLLVLKDESERKEWSGKTFLTINGMGSHFTGEGKQAPLKWTGVHFDAETFNPDHICSNCKYMSNSCGRYLMNPDLLKRPQECGYNTYYPHWEKKEG